MASGWGARKRGTMQIWAVNQSPPSAVTTIYAGLDTNTTVADDASNVTASGTEPSSSNGYARVAVTTWNTISTPSNDAAAQATNSTTLSWTSSVGGFSTGATTLKSVTLWNSSTLANVSATYFEGRAPMATPRAVDVVGITLTIASGGLVMGLISA